MIIKSDEQYRINFQEYVACASAVQKITHNHQDLSYLDFYGRDLLNAIFVMGLLPSETKSQEVELSRIDEIKFKRHMIQSVLKVDEDHMGNRYLVLDDDKTIYFDSSEMGATNYWLGMIFSTLLAMYRYGFKYVIHYKRFEKSTYCTQKIDKISYRDSLTGKIVQMSAPDLIAMNGKYCNYGAFEAKGYNQFRNKIVEKAINQVQQIKAINGEKNILKIVSYSCITNSGINLSSIDPMGGNIELSFNRKIALLWQYLPIAELFAELIQRDQSNLHVHGNYIMYSGEVFDGIRQMLFRYDVFLMLIREFNLYHYVNEQYGSYKIYERISLDQPIFVIF